MCLSACGEDKPPVVQNFAPLHYDYLPKLRLNVGSIDVQDHSLPVGPQDVSASSPAVPAQALQQMARDRLFAAGTAGSAAFVIDQASIVRSPTGTLDGHLAVHLDIVTPSGGQGGFAEAQVARQHVPGSDPEDGSSELYALTRQMMSDMNVELEYQVRRSLQAWLVGPGGAPAAVVAQPLETPGAPQTVPPPPALPPGLPTETPDGAAPAAAGTAQPQPLPDQSGYQDPAPPPPPVQMSPPPGFLRAPPGTAPL